jgi:hypothetical protein
MPAPVNVGRGHRFAAIFPVFGRRERVRREEADVSEQGPVVAFLQDCCFCGKAIVASPPDPCSVTVETSGGAWQTWGRHARCFRDRLNPDEVFAPVHL